MKIYSRIIELISSVVFKFLMLLLVVLVSVVFANILLRYMGKSIRWADEVARLLFVWTSFLGMYCAYRKDLHPAFTLMLKKAAKRSPNAGRGMLLLVHVLVLAFLCIIFFGGLKYISLAKIQTTAVLRMSVGWMYAAAPIGVFLMILETIRKILLVFEEKSLEKLLDSKEIVGEGI